MISLTYNEAREYLEAEEAILAIDVNGRKAFMTL